MKKIEKKVTSQTSEEKEKNSAIKVRMFWVSVGFYYSYLFIFNFKTKNKYTSKKCFHFALILFYIPVIFHLKSENASI